MAKCIRCGKSTIVRGHVKLRDAAICTPCFKQLGFKLTETAGASAYTYDEIKDGKDAMFSKKNAPTRSNFEEYKVHGISYDNENGHSIQKLLSEFVKTEYADDKLTSSEIKEELEYDDKVYLYPTMDINIQLVPTEFDGEPAVKVLGETSPLVYEHIGWIPKRNASQVVEIINNYDYNVTGELVGGPYKYRDKDDKICTDSTEYGCRVYVTY